MLSVTTGRDGKQGPCSPPSVLTREALPWYILRKLDSLTPNELQRVKTMLVRLLKLAPLS